MVKITFNSNIKFNPLKPIYYKRHHEWNHLIDYYSSSFDFDTLLLPCHPVNIPISNYLKTLKKYFEKFREDNAKGKITGRGGKKYIRNTFKQKKHEITTLFVFILN